MSSSRSTAPIEAPDEARGGDRMSRIASADARDTLDRIQNSALLETGSVNMIGLDAIRRKLGDRWPGKRSRVWEHVEREFERRLSPADLTVRVDDVNYVIALPGQPGLAAQFICLSILQEVLKFFLGELRSADVVVRAVSSMAGDEIVSAPVDLTTIVRGAGHAAAPQPHAPAEQTAEAMTGPLADHAPSPKDWKPPLAGRSTVVPLAPSKRQPFELKLTVEPVWNLRRGLITSFVIDRQGGPAKTEASDLEEIDVATFVYAATILDEHSRQGGSLALHVPVSFTTLATLRARERLLSLTRPAREAMRAVMLIEICGLDGGVPPSRLIEVIGLVRSLCAGVLGRVRPNRSAMEAVKGCGLRGLVAEAGMLIEPHQDPSARLKAYASFAHPIAANVIVHGLPLAAMIDEAAAAGFTHASVAQAVEPE
jgi:hypothetical protein